MAILFGQRAGSKRQTICKDLHQIRFTNQPQTQLEPNQQHKKTDLEQNPATFKETRFSYSYY